MPKKSFAYTQEVNKNINKRRKKLLKSDKPVVDRKAMPHKLERRPQVRL